MLNTYELFKYYIYIFDVLDFGSEPLASRGTGNSPSMYCLNSTFEFLCTD